MTAEISGDASNAAWKMTITLAPSDTTSKYETYFHYFWTKLSHPWKPLKLHNLFGCGIAQIVFRQFPRESPIPLVAWFSRWCCGSMGIMTQFYRFGWTIYSTLLISMENLLNPIDFTRKSINSKWNYLKSCMMSLQPIPKRSQETKALRGFHENIYGQKNFHV